MSKYNAIAIGDKQMQSKTCFTASCLTLEFFTMDNFVRSDRSRSEFPHSAFVGIDIYSVHIPVKVSYHK